MTVQKGKECNRTDPLANENYECERLWIFSVPLSGKITLGPPPTKQHLGTL